MEISQRLGNIAARLFIAHEGDYLVALKECSALMDRSSSTGLSDGDVDLLRRLAVAIHEYEHRDTSQIEGAEAIPVIGLLSNNDRNSLEHLITASPDVPPAYAERLRLLARGVCPDHGS